MTLYTVVIVTQIYTYEILKKVKGYIAFIFNFVYEREKKCFVRVQFSALPFHTKVFHFLKGTFNCIKPLYIIINCENRTAEVMWYKNGLSTNNL